MTIIDTPGLGDTKGPAQDKENIDMIVKEIGTLGDIHAILFVCKSNEARLDLSLKYLIQEVQCMLPKSCKDNFKLCLTSVTNSKKIDVLEPLE